MSDWTRAADVDWSKAFAQLVRFEIDGGNDVIGTVLGVEVEPPTIRLLFKGGPVELTSRDRVRFLE